MIAVDTNVLIYAHRRELPFHRAARHRLIQLAEGDERWCIPVFCVGEFLRVITHPRIFECPHTVDEACEAIDRLLASPSGAILLPGERYLSLLTQCVRDAGAKGNLVFDAQIAALCLDAGVSTLLTEDRDFSRFNGIRTERLAVGAASGS